MISIENEIIEKKEKLKPYASIIITIIRIISVYVFQLISFHFYSTELKLTEFYLRYFIYNTSSHM